VPATLTATSLPDSAAVRLHLSASVADYPTLISETLTGLSVAAVNATASRWTTYGPWTWSVASDTNGGSLRFSPQTYTGTGLPPAESYGVRRTLTGLTVGRRYLVYLGLRSNTGSNDVIKVTVGGATALIRNPGLGPDGEWAVGESSSGLMPETPFVLDFVAAAPTAVLQLTNQGENQSVHFSYLWMRVVPVVASTLLVQSNLTADDAGVALYGAAPAGLTATRRFETVGNVAALYSAPSGPANIPTTVGLAKTLTGLTVGVRYRLTLAVDAGGYDADGGSGGTGIQWSGPYRVSIDTGATATPDSGPAVWQAVEFVATATAHAFRVTFKQPQTLASGDSARLRLGYYRLDSVPSADDAYTLTAIIRSDVNGSRAVRLYAGADLSNGELVTTDHEPALMGLVTYQATVHNLVTGSTEAANASATLDGVERSRIAPASMPQAGAWYDLAPDLRLGRETTTTLAQVINRDDPLVTLGSQTSRRGTLRIFADDYQMGTSLEQVFNRGDVVLLRQPDHPGLDMYVVGTRTSLTVQPEITRPRRWVLEVDYTEVAAPTTPLLGTTGWNVAASLARNATLAASRAEFPTLLDLLIGPGA
jgi:hypothetical protein